MYDKKVLHLLDKIIESVEVILERTETVDSVNAFLDSTTGDALVGRGLYIIILKLMPTLFLIQ